MSSNVVPHSLTQSLVSEPARALVRAVAGATVKTATQATCSSMDLWGAHIPHSLTQPLVSEPVRALAQAATQAAAMTLTAATQAATAAATTVNQAATVAMANANPLNYVSLLDSSLMSESARTFVESMGVSPAYSGVVVDAAGTALTLGSAYLASKGVSKVRSAYAAKSLCDAIGEELYEVIKDDQNARKMVQRIAQDKSSLNKFKEFTVPQLSVFMSEHLCKGGYEKVAKLPRSYLPRAVAAGIEYAKAALGAQEGRRKVTPTP